MRSRDTAILLHLRGNSQQAASELNGIMQSIDPSILFYDVETLKERRHDEEVGVRLNTILLSFFAAAALVLAVMGIYSILVYTLFRTS